MTDRSSHLDEERLALLASEEPDAEVSAHLAQCEFCRRRWQEYRAVRQALRSLPAPPLPRDFAAALNHAPPLRQAAWWWRYRTVLRAGTLLAATLLVVLLSAVVAAPRFLPSEDRQTTLGPSPVAELAPAAQPNTEEMRSAGIASQTPAILASETPSSTFAAATEATAKVPATSEQEPVSEMPRTIRLLAWVGIVVLAVLTLAGFWFGFLLPARRVRRFPVVRR